MDNILKSFQGMVDRLKWMDDTSKAAAYGKITDTVVNVISPPFIFDNAQLNDFYERLSFEANDGYIEMRRKLDQFDYVETYKVIMNNYLVDRHQFFLPPAVINAWYQVNKKRISLEVLLMGKVQLNL